MVFLLNNGSKIRSSLPQSWFNLILIGFFTILTFCSRTFAWGVDGHEIVATIAQTQLHPDVREYLCSILPPERTSYRSFYPDRETPKQHCHLAPLSSWPDRVHGQFPWSSHLHYINPVHDLPPQHCTYGEDGWQDHGTGNVLEAIVNYTSILKSSSEPVERDLALRFLVHFMGDSHQPLHLTGLARGGNDVHVRFNGRFAKLHSVWDSLLLNDEIRDLANYTTRLPSARIESALLGRRYDAYIRWILAEGLGQAQGANGQPGWWADESDAWSDCPDVKGKSGNKNRSAHWLRSVAPHSSKLAQRIYATIFRKVDLENVVERPGWEIDETDLPVCPYAWTKPMHPLVCSYGFADPVPPVRGGGQLNGPLVELNVPEYAGRIHEQKILHRQLARAGVRLAAVLNTLLLPEAQKGKVVRVRSAEEDDSLVQVQRILTQNYLHLQIETEDIKKPKYKHGGHHMDKGGKNSTKQSPIFALIKVTASSIAEVIILASVGFMLARQGVLDKRTQTKVNKINVSFFTPALLFSKVAFSLDPGRLAELAIVPIGFVLIIVVSGVSAIVLSWMARLSRSQRNFTIACAITPNSNSLPVALMQSLVVTVPQLHWEEEGEPEDTVNGMLGRALTYLVLFSTLGMFLRWSLASQLLSTMDDTEDTTNEEPVTGVPTSNNQPPTGRLIDHDSEEAEPAGQTSNADISGPAKPNLPQINVRKSTEDGGGVERINTTAHHKQPGWARSFPNSPGDSEEEEEEEGVNSGTVTPRWQRSQNQRSCTSSTKQFYRKFIKRPYIAVTRFMTMPLYAALLSLIVALIPPLQAFIGGMEPLVGALETAGACSIPLTIVVLGAYFYEETDTSQQKTQPSPNQVEQNGSGNQNESADTEWNGNGATQSTNATLVNTSSGDSKRGLIPFMRNPWKSLTGSEPNSGNGSLIGDSYSDGGFTATEEGSVAGRGGSSRRQSSASVRSLYSAKERKQRYKQSMERRTIVVAVGSRMLITPLILLPLLAWYAIKTKYNVVDDPVFICSACLLIGSPPALTLAQITSQNASKNGGGEGGSSFERLISKTIFWAYAILATPTTIILVLTALLIAENDH